MKKQPVLTTKRLNLRPFKPADAESIQALIESRKIAEETFIPYPYDQGMAEDFIDNYRQKWNSGTGAAFAIELLKNHQLVGSISFKKIEKKHDRAEIGYWIGISHWGHGYATEAVKSIVDFGFDRLNLNRIYAQHFHTNPASGKVLMKAGFSREGVLRQHVVRFGEVKDCICYSILKNEWQSPSGD